MDKPDIVDTRHSIDALRRLWRAQPAALRLGLGIALLATGGAMVGLTLAAAMAGLAGSTGMASAAAVGAVVAMLLGPLVSWLAAAGRDPGSPELAFPPQVEPIPAEDPGAIRDPLTGAFSQRYFIAAADREWSRIRRHGEDAALLMIDADQLQVVNDAHGMDCGDAVLVQLTRIVTATLRQYDLMARFNAGVLVVYLPHTDPLGAIDVAERIRDRVASHRMNWPSGAVSVTVSIGVAAIGNDHGALDAVIGDAGAALRQAKAAGRNCVRAAPVPAKRMQPFGAPLGDRRAH